MLKENLEKAITDQQKIGRIHKLIAVLFLFSSSESPSEMASQQLHQKEVIITVSH